MTQISLPWTDNAIGDGHAYTDAEWWSIYRNVFNRIGANYGVMRGSRSEFMASGAATPVTVQPGTCIVDGTFHDSDANENIAVSTPAAATRIDLIVARKNFAAQQVRLYLLQGVEGGGAPTPVQIAGNTWDLPLWQISTTTGGVITFQYDLRVYAAFATEFAFPPILPGGRLTLTSGTPVTTSDVTAATTLYYTPLPGRPNRIPLYVNSAWRHVSFTEKSLTLVGLTASTLYDIWGYLDSSGALALEALAWASSAAGSSSRATALTTQDGLHVKTGDASRLYLGTIMIDSTGGQSDDTVSQRLLWNRYNPTVRELYAAIASPGHIYGVNSWRAREANTTIGQGRVEVVIGVQQGAYVKLEDMGFVHCSSYTVSNPIASIGFGLNSVSVDSADSRSGMTTAAASDRHAHLEARARFYPVEGYNWIQRLEISNTTGTTTFYEDNSAANEAHHAMALTGELEA